MGYKVLLADDSITVQKIVKLSLTEEGIEVIALGNGEQAIQQMEAIQPDLVMADVFMPGKDGYEVCEHVKSHPQLNHIPVILLVHAFEPFDPERAKLVCADHQLTKPFQSIRTLVTTVRDMLNNSTRPVAAAVTTSVPAPPPALSPIEPSGINVGDEFAVVSSLNSVDSAAGTTSEPDLTVRLPNPPEMSAEGLMPPLELPLIPKSDWTSPGESDQPINVVSDSQHVLLQNSQASDVNEVLDVSDVLLTETNFASLSDVPANDFSNDPAVLPMLDNVDADSLALQMQSNAAPTPEPNDSAINEGFDIATGQVKMSEETIMQSSSDSDLKPGTIADIAPAAITEELIEEIVNRVVQRLSTKAIQEIAWEVVPEMTEILLRRQLSQQQPGAQ